MKAIRRATAIVFAFLAVWGTRDTIDFIRLIAGPESVQMDRIRPGIVAALEVATVGLLFGGAFFARPRRATSN